jgi:hypothetical protein
MKIMLGCRKIIRGTSKEIVKTLETYVKTKALDWIKCVRTRTDGGRTMCGKNSSRPTVTQVHEVSLNASRAHCNNHREVLISKTFITENEVTPTHAIISVISAHFNVLKYNFDCYFLEEKENCQQKNWTANPFQSNMTTGLSAKAEEDFIDLSEDT